MYVAYKMASFGSLFNNKLYSDIVIKVVDTNGSTVSSIAGHRDILASVSPFLKGVFHYEMPSTSIDIECCEGEPPATVVHALRLAYDCNAPDPPDISRPFLARRLDYFQLDDAAAKLLGRIGDWKDVEVVQGYRSIATLATRACNVEDFWGPPVWGDHSDIDDVRVAVLSALYRSTSDLGVDAYKDVLELLSNSEMEHIASCWNRRVASMDDDLVFMLGSWRPPNTEALDAALSHVRPRKLTPVARQMYVRLFASESHLPKAHAEFLSDYCGSRHELPECRFVLCPHDELQIVRASGAVPEWLGLHVATDGDSLYVSAGRRPIFVNERFGWDTCTEPFNASPGLAGPVRVSYTIVKVRGTETGTIAIDIDDDVTGELFLDPEHGFSAIEEVCDVSHLIDDHIEVNVLFEVCVLRLPQLPFCALSASSGTTQATS